MWLTPKPRSLGPGFNGTLRASTSSWITLCRPSRIRTASGEVTSREKTDLFSLTRKARVRPFRPFNVYCLMSRRRMSMPVCALGAPSMKLQIRIPSAISVIWARPSLRGPWQSVSTTPVKMASPEASTQEEPAELEAWWVTTAVAGAFSSSAAAGGAAERTLPVGTPWGRRSSAATASLEAFERASKIIRPALTRHAIA